MNKFHVKYGLGGGTIDVFANSFEEAKKIAFVEYRKNACNIAFGLENHSINEVIDTIDLVG